MKYKSLTLKDFTVLSADIALFVFRLSPFRDFGVNWTVKLPLSKMGYVNVGTSQGLFSRDYQRSVFKIVSTFKQNMRHEEHTIC